MEDWLPKTYEPVQVFEKIKIPYVAYFSFGENLPALTHGVADPEGLGFAFDMVAGLLAEGFRNVADVLGRPAAQATTSRQMVAENANLQVGPNVLLETDPTVASGAMKALYCVADRVARSSLSVLVTGETGTGKEVLARWIHARSGRSAGPFQTLNCAALPEGLLEDHLFGHERGAFTGAVRSHRGLIEAAQGGTVFLDEIDEASLAVQAKLLRLLESREVRPLGAARAHKVDVRFIAATNQDLTRAVDEKRFRPDLLSYIRGVELRIPPLRERRDDVLSLARAILARFARREMLQVVPALSEHAEARLLGYPWPGNIRELATVLHRALVLSDGVRITENELALDQDEYARAQPAGETTPAVAAQKVSGASRKIINPSKREITEALTLCNGNQTRTAERLGIPSRTRRNAHPPLAPDVRSWTSRTVPIFDLGFTPPCADRSSGARRAAGIGGCDRRLPAAWRMGRG